MVEGLCDIPSIGPKRVEALNSLGIYTPYDLVRYMPRNYVDFTCEKTVADICVGESCAMELTFCGMPKHICSRGNRNLQITVCQAVDKNGEKISLTWFNQPYVIANIAIDKTVHVYGRIDAVSTKKMVVQLMFNENPFILPVYPKKRGGVPQKLLRECIRYVLANGEDMFVETLPQEILAKFDFMPLRDALSAMHFPSEMKDMKRANERLVFEDMLSFGVCVNLLRTKRKKQAGIAFSHTNEAMKELKSKLAFDLTSGQEEAIKDIAADMKKPVMMNRLVQGDVGSGKTVTGIFAMITAKMSGYQSAMLAPTEILANQHYVTLCKIVPQEEVCLLTASCKAKEKRECLDGIASGRYSYIVGTHAIFQENVVFSKLGLMVVDEQQRFGVQQRAILGAKGKAVDVLVMSATPIPRTLALVMYGDLDVSRITMRPFGKQPVKTRMVEAQRRSDMYKYVEQEAKNGAQAYVVCPQIESVDEDGMTLIDTAKGVYDELCATLSVRVGLLHGKMSGKTKTETIDSFRRGELDILVSTTVIEVGVDVPNACNMVVESADRFGLSQLHQLRGRIGRGKEGGYCFLITKEKTCDRLKVLCSTCDGFEIAEQDLRLRGPGQFLGHVQHGLSEMSALAISADLWVIEAAKECAALLVTSYTEKTQDILSDAIKRFGLDRELFVLN